MAQRQPHPVRNARFAAIQYRTRHGRWPAGPAELLPFMVLRLSWPRSAAELVIGHELDEGALVLAPDEHNPASTVLRPVEVDSDLTFTAAQRAVAAALEKAALGRAVARPAPAKGSTKARRAKRHPAPTGQGMAMHALVLGEDPAARQEPAHDLLRVAAAVPLYLRGMAVPRHALCHYSAGDTRHSPASTWDHVVPQLLSGPWAWWNIVPACPGCNTAKGHLLGWCLCDFCARAQAAHRAVRGEQDDEFIAAGRAAEYLRATDAAQQHLLGLAQQAGRAQQREDTAPDRPDRPDEQAVQLHGSDTSLR